VTWLFPKLKNALKGTHFESVEAVKTKAKEVLKTLQEKDFQHCFNQWKIRIERYVKHGEEYIEGENVKPLKNINKKFLQRKSRYLLATRRNKVSI